MLSYQHGYHAGNFADVIKHATLTRILTYLVAKDKPFVYIDTHAGRGVYDLKDTFAAKTQEYLQGISLLWEARNSAPALFQPYVNTIKALNPLSSLRYYPGSPAIALDHVRAIDRVILHELHPREASHLDTLPHQHKRCVMHHCDGIQNLNALLPPRERRGLIFIDPSYEIKDDYKHIPQALLTAYNRFATGVYCLWYPIVDNKLHSQLLTRLHNLNAGRALRAEFYLTHKALPGMTGCGLWIINPPYVLQEELMIAFEFLRTIFNTGISSYLVETVCSK